jgi:hypothetical protein
MTDGSYGRLAVSRALLAPLLPALRELQQSCEPELTALFKIPRLQLSKDSLELDPKF